MSVIILFDIRPHEVHFRSVCTPGDTPLPPCAAAVGPYASLEIDSCMAVVIFILLLEDGLVGLQVALVVAAEHGVEHIEEGTRATTSRICGVGRVERAGGRHRAGVGRGLGRHGGIYIQLLGQSQGRRRLILSCRERRLERLAEDVERRLSLGTVARTLIHPHIVVGSHHVAAR